jgi:hypothetical protein
MVSDATPLSLSYSNHHVEKNIIPLMMSSFYSNRRCIPNLVKRSRQSVVESKFYIGVGFELAELNRAYHRVKHAICSGREIFASPTHRVFYCTRSGSDDEGSADRWHIERKSDGKCVAFACDHRGVELIAWKCKDNQSWAVSMGRLQSTTSQAKFEVECSSVPRALRKRTIQGFHGGCNKVYQEHRIAGFVVFVEKGTIEAFGLRLIRQLCLDLQELARVIPALWFAKMRVGLRIWVNRASLLFGKPQHGACHHSSEGWLLEHENMVEKVHSVEIHDAHHYLTDRGCWSGMLLHECSHWVHHEANIVEGAVGWTRLPAATISFVAAESGAVQARGFPSLGMNGVYIETGKLCSERPIYSNGVFYLYRTDSCNHDDSKRADRWHVEIRPLERGKARVLAYACGGADLRTCNGHWNAQNNSSIDVRITEALEAAVALGIYNSNQERANSRGRTSVLQEQAYCMTDYKEYFAVCSTAFFSSRHFFNDYYPFTHGELREYDSCGYQMCEQVWGIKGEDVPTRHEVPIAYPERA